MKFVGKDATTDDGCRLTQGECFAKLMKRVIRPKIFSDIKLHGNTNWTPVSLVQVALLWTWGNQSLVERAEDAISDAKKLFGATGVGSYQVLTNALVGHGEQLLSRLWLRLQGLMSRTQQANFRIGMWLVLAVDGTRVSTSRTLANEREFSQPGNSWRTRKKRKKRRKRTAKRKVYNKKPLPVGPQVWLTLLWHVGQRMPWAWSIGPSNTNERKHFLDLCKSLIFPKNTLFCGDAGFVGYEVWKTLHDEGHQFLIRVGRNCRLLNQLGHVREKDGIVYSWPEERQRRNQPPVVLRLLRFHDGYGEVYLVTNELSERKLSDARASEIYRKRWGIEVQFRTLKQTCQRTKLLGRTPEIVKQELHWSIAGLWLAQFLALEQQPAHAQTSVAGVLRVIRSVIRRPDKVPKRGHSLARLLALAVTDNYIRTCPKKSRDYPRRKAKPSARPPKLSVASQKLKERAARLSNEYENP